MDCKRKDNVFLECLVLLLCKNKRNEKKRLFLLILFSMIRHVLVAVVLDFLFLFVLDKRKTEPL